MQLHPTVATAIPCSTKFDKICSYYYYVPIYFRVPGKRGLQ